MKKKLICWILLLALLLPAGASMAETYYRVNTTWLKAREEPSYSARVLDSYRRDFAVTIEEEYPRGWALVTFLPSGNEAFVQQRYLKKCSRYTAYITTDKVLLRQGPATSFPAMAALYIGTQVKVLTHGARFDYVSTPEGYGYVMNVYLSKTDPIGDEPYITNPTGRKVNMRTGPGKQYRVIAEYKPGTRVRILKWGRTWTRVGIGRNAGYIMTKYIANY